ncbi:MAG: hypothetical protein IJ002_06930 [Clostridia bacterium]|nr:hypothetical protein [Clostridia bacterium]
MFRKLLKYDIKAVWGIWRVMAVILVIMSVVGSFVMRFLNSHIDKLYYSSTLSGLMSLFVLTAVLSVFAAFTITAVLVFIRFHKNFFTDEGYLTFTLPVSRGMLLRAKTANATIWALALIALYMVCALPFIFFSFPENGEIISFWFFELIGEFFDNAWKEAGAITIVYCIEAILFLLTVIFAAVVTVQFCITVSSIVAKKANVLVGIGVFYGLNLVVSAINEIVETVYWFYLANGFNQITRTYSNFASYGCNSILFLTLCMAVVTGTLIVHALTRLCIERKLNLA